MISIAIVDDAEWARPFIERHFKELTSYQIWNVSSLKSAEPDIVFFGDGKKGVHRSFKTSKMVFVTCEDLYPDFSAAHFIISCRYVDHDRYLRMPYWALINDPKALIKLPEYAENIIAQKREFCAFVQSNHNPRRTRRRLEFFKALNQRRFVHSGGSTLNNIGYRVQNIHDFLSGFKLFICFENARSEGYTTEKIANAMLNGCVPIYWGDPLVHLDLNPRSFINVASFSSDVDVLDHIEQVADDEALRRKYLEQPFFLENKPPALFDEGRIKAFFQKLIQASKPRKLFFSPRAKLEKLKHRIYPYVSAWSGARE